jgi:signal transduction histidine kinase
MSSPFSGRGRLPAAQFSGRGSRFLRTESFRLTAIFAVLLIGAMLVLMGMVYLTMDRAFRAELLQGAESDLMTIRKAYDAEGPGEAREVMGQLLANGSQEQFFLLETKAGQSLVGNLPAMAATPGQQTLVLPPPPGRRRSRAIIGDGMMIGPSLFAFAGRDLSFMDRAEEGVLRDFAWVLGGTLALALTGGTLLSIGFLGRMDAMAKACRAIMQGRLKDRIPKRGSQDELDHLADAINTMLDRIGGLMENVRQISGDIAHDLRTPLTRLRSRLELARAEAASMEDYEQAVERAIQDSDNILTIFSALLRIGEMESSPDPSRLAPVALSGLLAQLAEIYKPAAEDSGKTLAAVIAPHISVLGDRALLSQLFSNLIENAVKHTPEGTAITIGLIAGESAIIAFVADDGPGIPPDERDKVFRPFYRMESARSMPGSGLGLALVAAIAKYHQAAIEMAELSCGLQISIVMAPLPAPRGSDMAAPFAPSLAPERSMT